jgi:excisionase family DNA binding protein
LKNIDKGVKNMDSKSYLDFDEAVVLLKTTPSTLYKWLQNGKVPGHKLGRQWRFLRDELEGFMHAPSVQTDTHKETELLLRAIGIEHQAMGPIEIFKALLWHGLDGKYSALQFQPRLRDHLPKPEYQTFDRAYQPWIF